MPLLFLLREFPVGFVLYFSAKAQFPHLRTTVISSRRRLLAVTMSNSHLPCSWWYLNKPHLNQWTLHTTLLRNLLTWTAPSYWWKYHATVALKLSEGKKLSNTSDYLKVSNFGYSILLSVITVWWQWVYTEVHFWHWVRLYQPTREVDRASIAGCLQKQNL